MTAEEMKAKCLAIAEDGCSAVSARIANAIAAIPIEPDQRDAQIAELREPLQWFLNNSWVDPHGGPETRRIMTRMISAARLALAATDPRARNQSE